MKGPALVLLMLAAVSGLSGRAGAASPEPEAAPPAEAVDPHLQVRRILEQPIYQRWKLRQEQAEAADPGQSELNRSLRRLMDRWSDWLDDWLRKRQRNLPNLPAVPAVSGFGGKLRFVGWAILAAALAFCLFVLYSYLRKIRAGVSTARVLNREQVREALAGGEALAMTAPDWVREADRLVRERNFRAVYRALYLALLSGLHQAGKIDFRKDRTNWTYVHRYRGPDSERATFGALTGLFDTVWYGLKPAEDTSVDAIKQQMTALMAGGDRRA